MALTFGNLTVHTQDGAGTWLDYGGGGGSAANTDNFQSGTGSRARKVSNGIKGFGFDLGAGGVNLASRVVAVRWATLAGVGTLNTRTLGGVKLRLETTTGQQYDWNIDGNDSYRGGWKVATVSTATTPSAGGTPVLTAVRYIGLVWDMTAGVGGGDPNCYIDEILSFPDTGLTLSGTAPGGLVSEMLAADDAGKYGILESRSGVTFAKGRLAVTPSGAVTSVGETLVFEDPRYYQGASLRSTLSQTGLTLSGSQVVTLNRLTLQAHNSAGTVQPSRQLNLTATNVDVNVATFQGFDGAVNLGGPSNTFNDASLGQCAKVNDTGAVLRDCIIRNGTDASGAYAWKTTTDMQDTLIVSDGSGYGIDMQSAPTDPTPTPFVGIRGQGFGANDTADATVRNNTGHDVYLAASGGTSGVTVDPTSTTAFANTVVVSVTVQDSALNPVEGARVFVEADTGGPLPSREAVSISSAATVATVTHTAHGLSSGAQVIIRGAGQDPFNGLFTITVLSANSYSYTMASSPGGAATGSPTSSALIVSGTTDATGVVQNAAFDFLSDQPVIGKARKASSAPYLKSTPIVGTITDAGLDVTIVAVPDE